MAPHQRGGAVVEFAQGQRAEDIGGRPVALLRNEADTKGNHWLGVALAGERGRDVVGTRLILEAGGRQQTRFATGGGSYASSSDRRHVFGLGTADRADQLTVVWPDGKQQQFKDLKPDRYYRVTQGTDRPEPLSKQD